MDTLLSLLLEPLGYAFMQRGLIAACLVATVCAVLSCFLVLRGWSLMGDAISHAVLPGLLLAYLAGLPLALGAFAAGTGCAFACSYLKVHSRLREDAVMAIVFSGMFAFGLVLLSKVESDIHLLHVLFGNVLGVSWQEIGETALIALLTLGVVLVKGRDLLLFCFDAVQAQAAGLPVRLIQSGFMVLIALAIVASLQAVGIILVVAMLVTPGATALMLVSRFQSMLVVAVTLSVSCAVLGTLISFHVDAATGPLIIVLQGTLFMLACVFSPKTGLLKAGGTKGCRLRRPAQLRSAAGVSSAVIHCTKASAARDSGRPSG
ncbi:metal ABC transporter permease [Marinobacterium rhizophilum]|uniref:Metal ABC transporter permease n=1 Tax=Marinobacterium rhizophilum TaxID=420402 RepID=A0ABY5HM54_9GAMM|nr:metal ABC transporter permease [Marinobacterium rhizophilum]UTW12892.1 metal ABC transporter permease [Marinobacterium rhizophilum]